MSLASVNKARIVRAEMGLLFKQRVIILCPGLNPASGTGKQPSGCVASTWSMWAVWLAVHQGLLGFSRKQDLEAGL